MRSRTREERRTIAVLVVMTVAIVGYIVGHDRASAVPAEGQREIANAVTVVHFPSASGWRLAAAAPPVPGLSITQPLILAPDGDATRGALIIGKPLGGESSSLPSQVLARLPRLPSPAVVDVANTQAYRYSPLSVTGSGERLTLYTIPDPSRGTTAIVCYASAQVSIYMQACERLAAALTITSLGPNGGEVRAVEPLTPDAGYGRRIAAVAAQVDQLLLALRPGIRPGATRVAVSTVAGRLATGLAGVAHSLAGLRPPPAAGRVHAALSQSLEQAQAAYSALAAAVGAGNASDYATARTQIYAAEAGLSEALKSFALLGYQ